MKKAILTSLAVLTICSTVSFAEEQGPVEKPAATKERTLPENSVFNIQARIEKSRKEANERMEKNRQEAITRREFRREKEKEIKSLVKEYQTAKSNNKQKQKTREKIINALSEIRQTEIQEKEKELKGVKERIEQAEKELETQKHEDSMRRWANNSMERVLRANGNIQFLFDDPQNPVDVALAPYNKSQEQLLMLQQARMRANAKKQAKATEK